MEVIVPRFAMKYDLRRQVKFQVCSSVLLISADSLFAELNPVRLVGSSIKEHGGLPGRGSPANGYGIIQMILEGCLSFQDKQRVERNPTTANKVKID